MSLERLVYDNTSFATQLYQHLRQKDGNLFFSPYSISTALAMTYAGARGKTAGQMAGVLNFSLLPENLHPAFAKLEKKIKAAEADSPILIKIANALWPQNGYPFLEEYLALVRANYGEQITPLDYSDPAAARAVINAWVKEKTEAKIQELIPVGLLNPLVRLVLTNAIYFKGDWTHPFDPQSTQGMPFYMQPGKSVDAPLMRQQGHFRYAELAGFQLLELPYGNGAFSMFILLPPPGQLEDLERRLTFKTLNTWLVELTTCKVMLSLPRFKFSASFLLKQTLMEMGMLDAFNSQHADFSGMDGMVNWLYISAVLHKAFVEVNEKGTEAAAATAVVMKARGIMPDEPPVVFRADHPFLFMICENATGSILFLGRVMNPTLEE